MASLYQWRRFYQDRKEGRDLIGRSFQTDAREWTLRTSNHLNSASNLTTSIAVCNQANFVLSPGGKDRVNLVHQGFVHSSSIAGGDPTNSLVFIQGNFVESSPIKVLPAEDAVRLVGTQARNTRKNLIACPSLQSMCAVESAVEFAALPGEQNQSLQKQPNHFFVNPQIFLDFHCARSVSAKELAFHIISEDLQLEGYDDFLADKKKKTIEDDEDDDDDDNQKFEALTEARAEHETLLCFLWASATGSLVPVVLDDAPDDDPILDGIIRDIRSNATGKKGETRAPPPPAPPPGNGGLTGDHQALTDLADAAKGVVKTMNDHALRSEEEKQKEKDEKSILGGMSSAQRTLFRRLSRRSWDETPVLTDFMQDLAKQSKAMKATRQVKALTKDWEGTFAESGFHQFLTTGFVSEEGSMLPGGFTIFMFYPRHTTLDQKHLSKSKARIGELLGADPSDEIIDYLARQQFYVPQNPEELKIQIRAALDTLEKLLGHRSVSTVGLDLITRRFSGYRSQIGRMFEHDKQFGAKFVYSVDRSLQQFFELVMDLEEGDNDPDRYTRTFLIDRASQLLDKVADMTELGTILPSCLTTTESTSVGGDSKRGRGTQQDEDTPANRQSKTKPVENAKPESKWCLPAGKEYADVFVRGSDSLKNWPKLKAANGKMMPLCVKFQATKRCSTRCPLAHVDPSQMSASDHQKVSERFQKVYSTL